jgi:hypothetical protein
LKRDKDLEKQFKKEFHIHEFYFESLLKLFKKRTTNESVDAESLEADLNPFSQFEKEHIEMNPVVLNQATEIPDGLGVEIWNKLVEVRDRKIKVEIELFNTNRNLKEVQTLIQNVLYESEVIRVETEHVMEAITQFLDYKYLNIYNVELLLDLKQGQVEIPQAPIVTNYSDAVLLHRSVVEALNEQVKDLGKLKVDALTEMKDYRKGIHALDW